MGHRSWKFAMVASVSFATVLPLAVQAQQTVNKLESDSTGSYEEHNTTPPANATAARNQALNTVPGKVSAGKEPTTGRANGVGLDAGASSMSKKP